MNAVEADNVAEQGSRMRLDRAQKISIAGMASVIVGFNVVGWAVFGYLPEGPLWLGVAMILAASSWLLWSERPGAAPKAITA